LLNHRAHNQSANADLPADERIKSTFSAAAFLKTRAHIIHLSGTIQGYWLRTVFFTRKAKTIRYRVFSLGEGFINGYQFITRGEMATRGGR
jgi:hypothetical protein